jgi:hypothetical protein
MDYICVYIYIYIWKMYENSGKTLEIVFVYGTCQKIETHIKNPFAMATHQPPF